MNTYHSIEKLHHELRRYNSRRKKRNRFCHVRNGEYPYWWRGYYIDEGRIRRVWKEKKWLKRQAAKAVRRRDDLLQKGSYKKAYDLMWMVD
ncbi:MAG: hypothetical protein IJH82_00900 [Lachnospiraceae bacterium]|nr:hypothetical protein [Lachnospiraceae bacterium]